MRKLLVLLIVLAGCTAPGGDGNEPTQSGPPAGSPPAPGADDPDAPPSAWLDGFVRDEEGPVPGATVRIEGTDKERNTAGDGSFTFEEVPPGRHVVQAQAGDRNGTATVDLMAGQGRTIFIDLGQDVVLPPAGPEPTPQGFVCPGGNVTEPHATHGAADGMVWAALKTGFRAVVAWDGGGDTLTYKVDGQPERTVSSDARVFLLDGLREGGTLCFHNGGDWHALRLENAMHAFNGTYTANFLVLANERSNRNVVERASQRFADLIWDATDGHVRVGAVVVVYDHYERQQEAVQPCWNGNVGVHASPLEAVLCDRWFDVIFTHNVHPAAAGGTYSDGIQDPNVPIWMNALHEAGMLGNEASQVREVGSVLAHEVGHYMFGAQDLYPEAEFVSTDCYDARTGISIMSSSRDATEFDSRSTPCSGASAEYRPTWTLMRARFPQIAERVGDPLPGPDGDGGAFLYAQFTVGT